ncbi:hypothetical protein C8P68_10374 [Mucilaginibacter yixingensis]|uniref:Glycosyl hydrolase family 2 n=1 Tax=Mucilaginibacter yixingensis TaxID=1295612 RepID=A0A2T5JAN4_9SPHI|nr:hypothetical protein [Mucilaginibacter yixingensis]PTQ97915.1 hypothetical protein C8P68_10374 [Mucilaginibacter yixingensis]
MRSKYLIIIATVLLIVCGAVAFILWNPYPSRFKNPSNKAVYIRFENGHYSFYRFGKPFLVKGAAGSTFLPELHAAGGNTIRTWDTANLDSLLAEAERNHVAVVVGLFMPYNDNMDAFYNNDAKVEALYNRYQSIIKKYQGNKAILCWCLGNEMAYPVRPQFFKFYKVLNRFIDMIHREDPDHPVTTTLINFQRQYLVNIKLWTHFDFICFNVFSDLRKLTKDLDNFKRWWRGPFLITEWGIDGPWPVHEHTAWNAYIEPSSDKKAEQYRQLYEQYMPKQNDGFLGSMVFYWGYKQETTPTWFSLFDKDGRKSEAVNAMQYMWTGHKPEHEAPQVRYMLVDGKGARDNILYNPGVVVNAQAYLQNGADKNHLHYEWYVQPEDWFRVLHFYNQKKRATLDELTISQSGDHFSFHAPKREGPYRVYVNISDDNGYFATCNTPFYVIAEK